MWKPRNLIHFDWVIYKLLPFFFFFSLFNFWFFCCTLLFNFQFTNIEHTETLWLRVLYSWHAVLCRSNRAQPHCVSNEFYAQCVSISSGLFVGSQTLLPKVTGRFSTTQHLVSLTRSPVLSLSLSIRNMSTFALFHFVQNATNEFPNRRERKKWCNEFNCWVVYVLIVWEIGKSKRLFRFIFSSLIFRPFSCLCPSVVGF